ncbi:MULTISPECIES: HD-GYP domain-containing protein [Herbaspirillum]|uniref:HD-GYP domain metal-dependent phosphohydrolase n=3 Tax=Herbaspirillum frisingense TaxID=92645 RepID=A0AAI9N1V4_9BURK|nr:MULTISPECIES: HD-GYP domain-containing protein [Herbaspirillum]EOA02765.1 HD-GYP domain metal-dependent phosphohydrolase [Herbaspirillum frisingense GSF30]MCI1012723.1 HD-GYP domain-containing protein [Herbaspirillum sp. C7C2]
MLKKIKTEDLVLGMYFCGFEAAWLDHPFWKNKFLLKNENELKQAHASGIAYCWIDISRGLDVAEQAPTDAPEVDAEQAEPAPLPPEPAPVPAIDTTLMDAMALRETAKKATKAMFSEARMGKVLDMERCVSVVEEIASSVVKSPSGMLSVLRLKLADEYTYLHSVAVCALMVALGRTLGLDEAACREAGLGGFLHDVGKAFIPHELLNKPGKLTDEEFTQIKKHPELGYKYLSQDPNVPDYARDVCLHHHEKMDGNGYPEALRSGSISLYSRMAAICDVYDALTSDRPYKRAWDPAEAISTMATWTGHFDRAMFLAFVKTLGIYPVGSIVKLESGRSGFVIRQNAQDLTRPVLKVFRYNDSMEMSDTEILDLMATPEADTIVARGGEEWARLSHLDSMQLLSTGTPG